MTNTNRLQNIQKRLDKKQDNELNTFLKMERWIYDIGGHEVVTLQEWEAYTKSELKKGTPQKDLDLLEKKIRDNDGFMEITFVLDNG